jgi:heptosyltransferase-2
MPSWVGDAVMATPTLRLVRRSFPGAFIGAMVRPGIDALLSGSAFIDELHVEHVTGVMGPKRTAAKIRARRYDAAVLLTNSFSTALATRLAGIPRRVGYDRDGRGLLLTDRLQARKRRDTPPFDRSATNPSAWAPVPACDYYWGLGARLLEMCGFPAPGAESMGAMELSTTEADERAALEVLSRAGVDPESRFAVLNPGGNNPAKRWPAERFAAVADHLWRAHGVRSLVNGSPGEAELVGSIIAACGQDTNAVAMSGLGVTLSSLKGIVRRARVMVTNDTGPRHIAAAFGVPVVSLFGPTDPRWTTIPARETVITADPTLPEEEVADDHAERCRIERIRLESVIDALDRMVGG